MRMAGGLNVEQKVLYAILAFARAKRGTGDPPIAFEERFWILAKRPVTRERLCESFLEVFG